MALADQPLTLCAGSMVRYSFREFVDAAAASGFAAITVTKRVRHLAERREQLSSADMVAMVRDAGLRVTEIEGTPDWLPGENPARDGRELGFPEALELAAATEANSVLLYHDDRPAAALPELADAFAAACERAAEAGLTLTIEFLPWTAIPDVHRALAIVEAAGSPNGRVLLDSWHHRHSGATLALTPEQAGLVSCVQLADARPPESGDLIQETMLRRCAPGTGTLDLAALVAELAAAGVDCPVAAEVYDDAVRDLPAREYAAALADGCRKVLDGEGHRSD